MATGSKFGKSVIEASDAFYDFSCSPCADDGKNTEALFQCAVCQMLYCRKCVEAHNKFTKNHNVLDKSADGFGQFLKQTAMPVSSELPTDVCEEHHGEVIKMFCGHHDVVCCSICIAVKHRSCEGVEYIPNITKGLLKTGEKKKTIKSLETMKDELSKMKFKIQDELKLLKQKQDSIIDDIHELKRRIIARVEEIEKQSLKDVNEKYIELTREITDYGKKIDAIFAEVELRLDNLKNPNNDAQTFVDMNTAKMLGNESAKACRQRNTKNMNFTMDKEIENCIHKWTSFGRIKAQPVQQHTTFDEVPLYIPNTYQPQRLPPQPAGKGMGYRALYDYYAQDEAQPVQQHTTLDEAPPYISHKYQPQKLPPQPAGKGMGYRALYDYYAQDEAQPVQQHTTLDEAPPYIRNCLRNLQKKGQIFRSSSSSSSCEPIDAGWMKGTVEETGKRGLMPSNYTENNY